MPWNSNIITERISNSVVRTISGRVYILVGKMHWVANSGNLVQHLYGFIISILGQYNCKHCMD